MRTGCCPTTPDSICGEWKGRRQPLLAVCAARSAGGAHGIYAADGLRFFWDACGHDLGLAQFCTQASDQLRCEFRDGHAFRDDEFAAQNGASLILIRELAVHSAILALLIPAETSVGNRFGADELEGAEQGISLGYQEGLPQYRDFDKSLVRPEDLRHERCLTFNHGTDPLSVKAKRVDDGGQ